MRGRGGGEKDGTEEEEIFGTEGSRTNRRTDGQREPRGHKNGVLFEPDTLRQIALKFVRACVVIHAKVTGIKQIGRAVQILKKWVPCHFLMYN